MTEEEAKIQLFKIHQEYMNHTKKERLELYDEYQNKRNIVKDALSRMKLKLDENNKTK